MVMENGGSGAGARQILSPQLALFGHPHFVAFKHNNLVSKAAPEAQPAGNVRRRHRIHQHCRQKQSWAKHRQFVATVKEA